MQKRKWAYYLSKLTLIDEVLGFLYWAFAIYGIFALLNHFSNKLIVGAALCVYIFLVVILYMYVLKRITGFFKNTSE